MTSIGYGDVTPGNADERFPAKGMYTCTIDNRKAHVDAELRLVASVVMILSQLYFAKATLHLAVLSVRTDCRGKVFADLTFLTSMYNQWTLQRHQRMTQTRSALESMNIPKQLIQTPAPIEWYSNEAQSVNDQLSERPTFAAEARILHSKASAGLSDIRCLAGKASKPSFCVCCSSWHCHIPPPVSMPRWST